MGEPIISRDGRYLQMFDRLVDLETGLSTDVNTPNPIFVCEMFKNQFSLSYKHSLIESNELFSKMRKLIYPLLDNQPKSIMEYELKYGYSLLLETSHSLTRIQVIEEAWDFVKQKLYEQYPLLVEGLWDDIKSGAGKLWDKTKEVAGTAWDKVKEAGTWVLNKGLPWFMEKLEKFMLSPVGIGLDFALTAIGVGKLATGVIWGILLVWKIYQLVTGKLDRKSVWSYIDIAVCLVGVIFSGAAKGLKVAFKAAGGNVAKVGAKALQPILNVISKGASGIMGAMVKPLEWLAKFFGPKATNMISTFKSNLDDIFKSMSNIFKNVPQQTQSLGGMIKKGIKTDITRPLNRALAGKGPKSISRAAATGLAVGGGFYGLTKGLEAGAEKYQAYNQNKKSGEVAKLAQAVPDEVLKKGIDDEFTSLMTQMT